MKKHEKSPSSSYGNDYTSWDSLSEDTDTTKVNLPVTSQNEYCRLFLRAIESSGKMNKISQFIGKNLKITPTAYADINEFYSDNQNYNNIFLENLDSEETETLKRYTGTNFVAINTIARGFWDYEKLGKHTQEAEAETKKTINTINTAIGKAPITKKDFSTFRGTNIDSFKSYGVSNIAELDGMKGQFYLERGFTSTSINKDKSFANREDTSLFFGGSDIEIHYHIPSGSHDVAALLSNVLSYSPQQTEVLINKDSLFYVSDVKSDEKGHAVVDMLLIPKNVYDNYNENVSTRESGE